MKNLLLLLLLSIFFISCKSSHADFNSVKIDSLLIDKISIRAITVAQDTVWYAADKNRVGYSYYIKSTPNKILFNPTDLHTIEPKLAKSFLNKTCKSELMFLEVSESIFNMYLNFLKTENSQWLVKAQREIK